MKKLYFLVPALILVMLMLSGCGKVSENDIASFIPETITSYKLGGQLYTQEIKDIKIVKRQTEGKSDFIECEINLEDENMERTVYADLYLTKYDTGGWILDSWSPYDSEDYTNYTKPGKEIMDKGLDDLDYELADDGAEDVSSLDKQYVIVYTVNEKHAYATLKGTVTVTSYFSYDSATNSSVATCGWVEPMFPKEDISIDWSFEGTYSGVCHKNTDDERSFTATITSVDDDGNVAISGEYIPPAGHGSPEKFNSAKTKYGTFSKIDNSNLIISPNAGNIVFSISLDSFKVLDSATLLYTYDVTKVS